MSDALFRLRVAYAKGGRLRHLGHLEVLRAIERCVRRAGLPYAVTQGFSPHMRVQFSSALPTGVSSSCECYDVFVTSLLDERDALSALAASTPADIVPFAVAYVTREQPALEAWLTRSRWEAVVAPAGDVVPDADAVRGALDAIAAAGELTYLRGDKPKVVDLTQTLVGHDVRGGDGGAVRIALEARSSPSGALRPAALVMAALDAAGCGGLVPVVSRTGQWHEDEDGGLVSPMPPHIPWPT